MAILPDKLQTPQSFAQSVQELFIALQRTGDPAQLIVMSLHLDRLANIDASPGMLVFGGVVAHHIMKSVSEIRSLLYHHISL